MRPSYPLSTRPVLRHTTSTAAVILMFALGCSSPAADMERSASDAGTTSEDGAVDVPLLVPNNIPAKVHGFDQVVRDYQLDADTQRRGVIVIIDSGIMANLPVFGGRVTRFMSVPDGSQKPMDRSYHGTWSAAIAAGGTHTVPDAQAAFGASWPKEPFTWTGMVPNAEIWSISIDISVAYSGAGLDWPVVHELYREALDQVLQWKSASPDKVVSVSMINAFPKEDGTSHLAAKVAELQAAGIFLTSPAGNGAGGSNDPRAANTLDPGVDPSVVGAGALEWAGPQDAPFSVLRVADWGSRGNSLLPGPDIAVLQAVTPTFKSATEYAIAGGTSASSPTIAGGALLLQLLAQREFEAGHMRLNADAIVATGSMKRILEETANTEVLDRVYSAEEVQSGSLDLSAAAQELLEQFTANEDL